MSTEPLVVLLSDRKHGLTADDAHLASALRDRGCRVLVVPWDAQDALEQIARASQVVVRSTWDYTERSEEFLSWLDRVDARRIELSNSSATLRWNMNKRYLADLAQNGIRIVDTEFVAASDQLELDLLLRSRGWEQAVVKPTISATARGLFRTSVTTAATDQQELERLLRGGEVLIQPFLEEIETAGEWSLVFFGGEFSHAVIKTPRSGDFRVQSDFGGRAELGHPSDTLVEEARRALQQAERLIGSRTSYARVDGLEEHGHLLLMELELFEPELFFRFHAPAGESCARALLSSAN